MDELCPAAEELADLKATYVRLLDAKDWTALSALFAPGATFAHPVLGAFDDIEMAIEAVAERIGADRTVHHGHLTSVSPTSAGFSASFDMSSRRWLTSGRCVRTTGRYVDEFVLSDGEWRIATLTLVSSFREE